jgi:CHASE3 domain sensor protein
LLKNWGFAKCLQMSSSTVLAVAAFALFELITLGALFGVHQNAEIELNNQLKAEALAAQSKVVASRFSSLSYALYCNAAIQGPFWFYEVSKSHTVLNSTFDDIRFIVGNDSCSSRELAKLESVARNCDQLILAAQSNIKEACPENLNRGVMPFYGQLPALEDELDRTVSSLRVSYCRSRDTLLGTAISWQNVFNAMILALLVLHLGGSSLLLLQWYFYSHRDFDSGGTAGGVVLSSLGWMCVFPQLTKQQVSLLFVPVFLESIFLSLLLVCNGAATREATELHRAKFLVSQVDELRQRFHQSGLAMGGYSITKSRIMSERYEAICREIPDQVRRLRALTSGSLKQTELVRAIELDTLSGLKILREARIAIDDDRIYSCCGFRSHHRYKALRELADKLQDECAELTAKERALLKESPATQHKMRTLFSQCFQFDLLLHLGVFASCLLLLFKLEVLPVVSNKCQARFWKCRS